jgi:DNA-binding CsgD family transcriptional regulator
VRGRPRNPRSRDIEVGVEALRLYAFGHSGSEVASRLDVSMHVIRNRMKRLYEALGARDMIHAVIICAIDGLLTREDLRAAYEDRRDAGEGEG